MLHSSEEINRLKKEITDLKKQRSDSSVSASIKHELSELYGSISVGIMYYNLNGVVVECNEFFVQVIGSSKKSLIGLELINFVKDDRLLSAIKSSLSEGEGRYEGLYRSLTANKETPVRVILKGLRNHDNEIYGGICIAEDLTESKKTQDVLRQTEENYRLIFENTTDVYYRMDVNGNLLSLNPAAKELLLLDNLEDNIGRNIGDFFCNKALLQPLINKLLECRQIDGYRINMLRSDNSEITVEINLKIVYDQNNNIDSIVGVFYDISERLKSEKERSNHIWFLKKLKRIDEVIKTSIEDKNIIENVIKTLRDTLKCESISAFERNNEYTTWMLAYSSSSGNKQVKDNLSESFLNNKWTVKAFDKIVKHEGVHSILPDKYDCFDYILKQFKAKTQLGGSTTLNSGQTYLILASNCKDNQLWNEYETALFSEVINKLKDAINTYDSRKLLNNSEEYHRQLIEATTEGYWEVDSNGITLLANNAMCAMLGYSMDEFIGSLSLIHAKPSSKEHLQSIISQQSDTATSSFEVELCHKNGNVVHTIVNITQRTNNLNEASGTFFFVTDISNQKMVEQRLKDSETQLRLLFNAMSDAVIEIDYNGKYISIAPTRPNKLLPSNKSIGKTFHDFFPKPKADQLLSFVRSCLDDNEPKSIDYPVEKNNEIYWMEGRAVPKTANTILLVAHDITNRRSANHKLRQSERDHKSLSDLLRKIIDTSPEMIWAKDHEGNYTITNEAITRKLLNATDVDEPVGKNIMSFIQRERQSHAENDSWYTFGEECEETDNLIIQSKRPGRFDEHGIVFGKYIFLDVYKAPIFDEFGNVGGIVGFARDVTYEKRVEREKEDFRMELEVKNVELEEVNRNLKDALDKARESDDLKTSFIKNISHEVRTPLNGIVGFLEILNNENLTKEERTEYTNYVMNSSDQLTSIITDILEYSRLEAGQIKLNKSSFSINKVLKDLYSHYNSKLISKNKSHIKFVLHNSLNDENSNIIADEDKIHQVLSNLLSNAIKFTSDGEINYGYNITDTSIDFFVFDTGIGIPSGDKEIIFYKFRQGTGADTPAYGGNGLGLSISKSLTELMGGKLWFKSEVGKSTEFFVSIPMIRSNTDIPPKQSTSLSIPYQWNTKNVLIVDDVYEVYKLISVYLRDTRIIQYYAKNGLEAIELFKKQGHFDIILLDLHLPDIDGYETLKSIRDLDSKQVVVAQTAFAISNDKDDALAAGFNDYVSKPISRNELLEVMSNFL
jgi:PAS domain S-box-containing protein